MCVGAYDGLNEASLIISERLFYRQSPSGRRGAPAVTANMGMFQATIQICHVSLTTRRNGRPPGRCSHVLLASYTVSTHLVGPDRAAGRPEETVYSCAILVTCTMRLRGNILASVLDLDLVET